MSEEKKFELIRTFFYLIFIKASRRMTMTMTINIILFNIDVYKGVCNQTRYDVIVYIGRPYLKRRLRLR